MNSKILINFQIVKPHSIFVIILILSIILFSCKKMEEPLKNTQVKFEKSSHNFGTIASKQYVYTSFTIKNTGSHPLLIDEVKSSCGCTIPEWTNDKIAMNESGVVKVKYDAKHPGKFNKTIAVFYNGKDSPKKITIKGQVAYPKGLEKDNVKKNESIKSSYIIEN